jgi:hypothetical protein
MGTDYLGIRGRHRSNAHKCMAEICNLARDRARAQIVACGAMVKSIADSLRSAAADETDSSAAIPDRRYLIPNVWSGRALQVVSPSWWRAVLHQCIRPLIGACCAPGHHGISARAFSLADRPRLDHLGHQCSHAPGRPNLHLVSSSRRPRLETLIVTSSLAPHIAQFLCSSQGPFLRPGPQRRRRLSL